MREVFYQSQSWQGYERACESWHTAFWKWVDQEIPADFIKSLRIDWSRVRQFDWKVWTSRRNFDWSRLPCSVADRKRFLVEMSLQEYLLEDAAFRYFMRGADAAEPETYKQFLAHIVTAGKIGDDRPFKALAQQKQRKPRKAIKQERPEAEDRRLKYLLLSWWIPGCLWALTAKGIRQFLQDHCDVIPYHLRSIRRAWKELKLFHVTKPAWKGVKGTPAQLISHSPGRPKHSGIR